MADEEKGITEDKDLESSFKILVVDDEEIMRDALFDVLSDVGYKVFTAPNAAEALEILKKEPFDIIVTDIKMPGMDGIGFMEEIKKISLKIDIIVMTGYASIESAVAAMKLGAIDYITKPVNIDHIRIVVDKVIKERILEQRASETEFYKKLSQLDGLTGIFNHRFFQELLQKEIARAKRYNRSLALVILDVDNFKVYNDKNGHPLGDLALKKLAWVIKNSLRESDFEARYGGEEFVVILPDTSLSGAVVAAERLRILVERTQFEKEEVLPNKKFTISIGVAAYPQNADSRETLIERTDQALYQAKGEGRNRVCAAV
ncbi:MAG: diguanylate cyclase [Candidatus Omnitrophota bacterium]